MIDIIKKIYTISKDIKTYEGFSIIDEIFELSNICFKDCLLLIDLKESVLLNMENPLYNNLLKGKIDENSIVIKPFGGSDTCPAFYLLTLNKSIDLQVLGDSIEKSYKFINIYKTKYERLVTYLDAVQEGISAVDQDGNLVFVNNSCCDMLSTTKEEILCKNAGSISKGRPLLLEVVNSKQAIIDKEYFMEFKNRSLHLTSSAYPVMDKNGNIKGAIDIFRSISRSRKLANSIAGIEAIFKFDNIIGSSEIMENTIAKAKRMAISDETILIEGESGTGKELFAQAIHNYSHRKDEPFIAVNCASLPNELVESELFGYDEGAFTGALKGGRPGKFELANGGTLFLDEIGEMPMHIQTKLLRAVEYKYITRVGGRRTFNADVRIIAATNRNLEELVREGKFRGDLFYRLKVFYFKIPPLKERREDIITLAEYFTKKFSIQMKKQIPYIDKSAEEILKKYEWPGNVRELENCIARSIFSWDKNIISKEQILEAGIQIKNDIEFKENKRLYTLSEDRVKDVYEICKKNKKRASEVLGISRPTLYKLLQLYKIK